MATALRRFVDGRHAGRAHLGRSTSTCAPRASRARSPARSTATATYFHRWALVWERQAMTAGPAGGRRPRRGGRASWTLLDDFVWEPGLSADDVREIRRMKARVERERIPTGEDPQFHLKLGRGSLSDIEWTAQLLQLRYGVRATGTMAAPRRASPSQGLLDPADAAVLAEAYRFCEATRNRLYLVQRRAGRLAAAASRTSCCWLARSLDTTPAELREQYRRVTRRARTVVERLFYAKAA